MVAVCVSTISFAQKPEIEIKKVETPIVLDGALDAIWSVVPETAIAIKVDGEDITIPNAWFKACWDDDGVYVVVSVEDDNHFPAWEAGSTNHWEYDKPELYFNTNIDINATGGAQGGITTGRTQFAPTFIQDGDGVEHKDPDNDRLFSHVVEGENYIFEYFVPFSFLEAAPDGAPTTRPWGFDITVIDRDEGKEFSRLRQNWANDNSINESWADMAGCGVLKFSNDVLVSVRENLASKGFDLNVSVISGSLSLRSESVLQNVRVVDMTGRIVYSVNRVNASNHTINIGRMGAGIYIVHATDVRGVMVSKKFAKQ